MIKHQSKIEKLIAELCQKGVELRELAELEDSDLIELGRGNVISRTDLAETPGEYPVYSSSAAGVGEFGRYGKYMFDDERISWSIDGGGRFFYRPARKYSITNVSGWLKVLDESRLNTKYLYYTLTNEWAAKTFDYTKKAHPSVIRVEYRIPIPPLPIQHEIVKILNKFAELEAELEARRKQYEYYREELLTFNERVRWATLGEIGTMIRGNGLQKKDFTETGVGCIHYGQIYTYYGTFANKTKSFVSPELAKKLKKAQKGDVLIAGVSENIRDVCKPLGWLGDEICISGDMFAFRHNQNPKFITYLLQTTNFQRYKERFAQGTKVIRVKQDKILNYKIPLPPPSEQNRIVSILDKFDALVNDISVGLPAELKARRQQYEYYRNKLLTFPEYDTSL